MSRNLITAIIFSFILVVFALQNVDIVDVDLYFWHFESSLAIVLVVAFAIGALVGILFSLPGYFRKSKELRELKKRFLERNSEMSSGTGSTSQDTKNSEDTNAKQELGRKGMGSY